MSPRTKRGKTNFPAKLKGVMNDLEADFMRSVQRRKVPGLRIRYETEELTYVLRKSYLPDFVITLPGRKFYVETKGYFRPEDRTKMIAVKKENPSLDIRIVFPQDNKLRKGSKSRYSDWCRKHGFPFHVGTTIPEEWLK